MFCPRCGGEYRPGFGECASCGVALEAEPLRPASPTSQHVELVTVLESGDPALLAVAKSLLEEAGIPYLARGEGLQDLFAAGRMGTGFNPIVGPVALQVDAADAQRTTSLLADLSTSASPAQDEDGGSTDDTDEEP